MAVSAKRFNFMDKETNIPITDFSKTDTSGIWNSPNNEMKDTPKSTEDFMKSAKQSKPSKPGGSSAMPDPTSILDTVTAAVRKVKGLVPSVKDVKSMAASEVDAAVEALGLPLGQSQITSILNQLMPECKNQAAGRGGSGRPYTPSMSCNGKSNSMGSSACASSADPFASLLNKASGGGYQSTFNDLNAILASIIGLSSMGYDMNMCGVFGVLSGMTGNNQVLSRASGTLVGMLNAKQNMMGILDLAGSSAGLNVTAERPDVVFDISRSFEAPTDIPQSSYSDFTDRTMAAFDLFHDGWDASEYDGIQSTSAITSASTNMLQVFNVKSKDAAYDESHLNDAPSSPFLFMNTAMQMRTA